MDKGQRTWLAAAYHFPSAYSCRLPMSSMASALVSPAPGPATVRLALIRVGIELFGIEYVRDVLFPLIRSMNVHVRPPEKVALSTQVLRAYKADESPAGVLISEGPIYREVAHAEGLLTVYVEIPAHEADLWKSLLMTIGYWGQVSSFASCVKISETSPDRKECATPLQQFRAQEPLGAFFPCVLTEFRNRSVTWDEVVPSSRPLQRNPLKLEVYLWPLLLIKQHRGGKLLMRSPFPNPNSWGREER